MRRKHVDKKAHASILEKKYLDLYKQHRYEQALDVGIGLVSQLKKRFEQTRSKNPPYLDATGIERLADATECLDRLTDLYVRLWESENSELLLQHSSLKIGEAASLNHFDVAASLDRLAALYGELREQRKAKLLLHRSLIARKKLLGPDHLDVAESLDRLACFCSDSDYATVESCLQESLRITEKVLGPDHLDVAENLDRLADFYDVWRDGFDHRLADSDDVRPYEPEKAESALQRSLMIREKALGPDHPRVAASLARLAALYSITGNTRVAKPLYMRASIIEKEIQCHECCEEDKYEEALAIAVELVSLAEETYGCDHPSVAKSLDRLGDVYCELKKPEKAEPVLQRSLKIREKVLGPDHLDAVETFDRLGKACLLANKPEEAKPFFHKSLKIREKAHGSRHPIVATSLDRLADLYVALKEFKKAESLFQRSLIIKEKALGKNHVDVAWTLHRLAELYHGLKDYSNAESLLRRSLNIRKKFLFKGDIHKEDTTIFHLIKNLIDLALICVSTSRPKNAFALFREALLIENGIVNHLLGSLTEQTKFILVRLFSASDFLVSLVLSHFRSRSVSRLVAFHAWLSRKGLVLEAQKAFQGACRKAQNDRMKKIASELSRIRKLLSDLGFEGPTRGSTDGLNETVSVLVEEKDRKEAELAGLPSMEKMIDPITKREVERIGSLLPNGSVLIDFAKFRLYDFKEEKYLSSHYLAFLLRARTKKVDLIDLGDAEEIDDLIAELRKPLNLGVQGTGNDQHGVAPDFEKLVKKRGNTLYKRIFSPLVSKIKGATDIFVSPDGELNLIPFEVLVDDNDDYLIDCYTFTYVSTPREITTFGRRCDENSPPLLMGDPDFDQILETKAFPSERGHPDDRPYTSLPVTREEVEEIARYLNTPHYYTGKQASMDVLFQASSPRILHLATHGFFDPNIAYKQGDFPIRNVDLAEEFSNPLHRSGIVLAGANTSSCGILTAEKILSLSLEGTEMVVLSACETGLGRIKRGEGVFGLRRSFALAGAKSVVMSMWKVPDKETKQLMSYFYQNLSSMNRAKALKEAALSLRKDLSVLHGHNHPFFWGAFIFAGDRG